MKNYYEILEVNTKASQEIIEKAYRVLVKKYHPDLYSGEERLIAEQKIKEINEAYHVLSNVFLREQYDEELRKEQEQSFLESRREEQEIRTKKKQNNRKKETRKKEQMEEEPDRKNRVGTFMGMVDLTKEIFKKRENKNSLKNLKKEDKQAALITFIIVIVLGIALWFIPATNGFMKSLLPFINW